MWIRTSDCAVTSLGYRRYWAGIYASTVQSNGARCLSGEHYIMLYAIWNSRFGEQKAYHKAEKCVRASLWCHARVLCNPHTIESSTKAKAATGTSLQPSYIQLHNFGCMYNSPLKRTSKHVENNLNLYNRDSANDLQASAIRSAPPPQLSLLQQINGFLPSQQKLLQLLGLSWGVEKQCILHGRCLRKKNPLRCCPNRAYKRVKRKKNKEKKNKKDRYRCMREPTPSTTSSSTATGTMTHTATATPSRTPTTSPTMSTTTSVSPSPTPSTSSYFYGTLHDYDVGGANDPIDFLGGGGSFTDVADAPRLTGRYTSWRYGGNFHYTIPVATGMTYYVQLFFVQFEACGQGRVKERWKCRCIIH